MIESLHAAEFMTMKSKYRAIAQFSRVFSHPSALLHPLFAYPQLILFSFAYEKMKTFSEFPVWRGWNNVESKYTIIDENCQQHE
jgi:hypothetical protein